MAPSHAQVPVRGRRSVDRGKCRQGIEPRNTLASGVPTLFFAGGRQHDRVALSRVTGRPSRGRRPQACTETPCARTGRSHWLPASDGVAGRNGKAQGRIPMTNDQRKSDRPVVPTKSPNKAEQPAAEAVEGRGLAKGNADEQNAPRTQCRISAPSALDRVREAATRNKGKRSSPRSSTTSMLNRLRRRSVL